MYNGSARDAGFARLAGKTSENATSCLEVEVLMLAFGVLEYRPGRLAVRPY